MARQDFMGAGWPVELYVQNIYRFNENEKFSITSSSQGSLTA